MAVGGLTPNSGWLRCKHDNLVAQHTQEILSAVTWHSREAAQNQVALSDPDPGKRNF